MTYPRIRMLIYGLALIALSSILWHIVNREYGAEYRWNNIKLIGRTGNGSTINGTSTTDTPSRDKDNQTNAQNSHFSNRRPSVPMSTATPRSDTPSSSPITHSATREIPVTPPPSSKLELKYGISLKDCKSMYKLVDRKCRSYEDLRFLRPDEAKRTVALASFPGSGNTWVRLMLEQVTGVFTGSVYNDKSLRCTGFLAEGFEGRPRSEMVAVKTHESKGDWDTAIFLVRNPYKAMVSYNNFMETKSHTKTRSAELFNITKQNFAECLDMWERLWEYYIFNQTHPFPVRIIEYENLINNVEVELKKMVVFLNQTIQPDIMKCLLNQINDNYQRKMHRPENPFSSEQTSKIEKWIADNEHSLKKLGVHYEKWKWE